MGTAGNGGVDPGAGDPGAGDPGAGDPGTGDPGAGDPGAGDPGTGNPAPAGDTAGTVTIEFTTVTTGGEYAPANYGAVWFEQPDGTFIKTATRWAGSRHASDLVTWTAASGGWGGGIFGGAGNAEDMMDAMSQATIRSHESHTVMWDFMVGDELLPDGPYVAVIEVSEDRAARPGPVVKIEFTKGPEAQTAGAPDQDGFSGVSLSYTP